MNYKLDSANEYQFVKLRKWIAVLCGALVAIIGLILFIVPRKWIVFIFEAAESKEIIKDTIRSMKSMDRIIQYWFLFLPLGAIIISVTIFMPVKEKVIVTIKGFTIVTSSDETRYLFKDIKKIVDYYSNGQRKIKVYFQEKSGVLSIKGNRIEDYPSLFHDLKEKHKYHVLGKKFPENIESIRFPVSKHVKVDKGNLIYKDTKIPFSKIAGFTIIEEENTYNMGVNIAVPSIKQKIIKILPSDIQNDDAIYEILSIISEENPS